MSAIPDLDRHELRKFGFTFGGIIAALFGVILPWLFSFSYPYWPWIVLIVFIIWGLAAPDSIRHFYKLWMRFGLLLNAVMSRIILGIVFYGVVFPTGLIKKIKGGDAMQRKFDDDLSSYRIETERVDRKRMEKPF